MALKRYHSRNECSESQEGREGGRKEGREGRGKGERESKGREKEKEPRDKIECLNNTHIQLSLQVF